MAYRDLGDWTAAERCFDEAYELGNDLREAIVNFDELRARYAGTRYESMFDEVLAPA
jgi:hypothetical protein